MNKQLENKVTIALADIEDLPLFQKELQEAFTKAFSIKIIHFPQKNMNFSDLRK